MAGLDDFVPPTDAYVHDQLTSGSYGYDHFGNLVCQTCKSARAATLGPSHASLSPLVLRRAGTSTSTSPAPVQDELRPSLRLALDPASLPALGISSSRHPKSMLIQHLSLPSLTSGAAVQGEPGPHVRRGLRQGPAPHHRPRHPLPRPRWPWPPLRSALTTRRRAGATSSPPHFPSYSHSHSKEHQHSYLVVFLHTHTFSPGISCPPFPLTSEHTCRSTTTIARCL